MSEITLNWNRVVLSVRQYPPKVIEQGFRQIVQSNTLLQRLVEGSGGIDNVTEIVVTVLRESIIEENKDKEYFLKKIAEMHQISEKIRDYLEYLVSKTHELGHDNKDEKEPYHCLSKDEPASWIPDRRYIDPKRKSMLP
jgi:hypothetical protein